MLAMKMGAFCPRCGREVESVFDLKPDASKALRSIACADCLSKTPPAAVKSAGAALFVAGAMAGAIAAQPGEVAEAAVAAGPDVVVNTGLLAYKCTGCDAPVHLDWKFCVYCRRDVVKPS